MSGNITALANGNNVDANGLNANFNALNNPQLFLISPNTFASNITLNSGSTNTYTAWGTGGIPTNATAVLINAFFTPSAAGTFASFTPHGTTWNNGNYPIVGTAFNSTNICAGSMIVPLDGSAGKFDVKANSGNCTGFYIVAYGYVY